MQNTTNISIPHDVRLIHNILGTTIFTVGFIANCVTLVAIFKYRLYRDNFIIFIINLAMINCLTSGFASYISCQSFTVESITDQDMDICRIAGYIIYSLLGTEIVAIIHISFNRYFLIVQSDIYGKIYQTKTQIVTMLAVSWLIYFVLTFFPYSEIWGKLLYDPNRFFCHPFKARDSFARFYSGFSITISAFPLAFCYIAIVRKVFTTRSKVLKRGSTKRNTIQTKKHLTKMPITVLSILTAFVILYIPFFLVSVLDPAAEKYDPKVHVLVVYVTWLHLICHPIIYAIWNNKIQKALVKMFGCRTKNSVYPKSQNSNSTMATSKMEAVDFKLSIQHQI